MIFTSGVLESFHKQFLIICCSSFRLRRHASLLSTELGSGDQFGRLLEAMKLQWACFFSLQLLSLPGFHLFLNFKLECYSTKHSAEVYKFLVSLVGTEKIVQLGTKNDKEAWWSGLLIQENSHLPRGSKKWNIVASWLVIFFHWSCRCSCMNMGSSLGIWYFSQRS